MSTQVGWVLDVNPINVALGSVIGLVVGGIVAWLVVFLVHERREFRRQDQQSSESLVRARDHETNAKYREQRAMERHDVLMSELVAARRIATGIATSHRAMAEKLDALELAVDDHASHLEALGRNAARLRRKGGM